MRRRGGAAEELRAKIYVSKTLAWQLREGDENAMHLTQARAAGIYPKDYRVTPCPVDVELTEGDVVRIGKYKLQVLATSGQCRGHVSFYGRIGGKNVLFAGDTVFFGGKILPLATRDCSLADYKETIRKLAKLKVDVLLPSHGSPSLSDGQRHLRLANQCLDHLALPPLLS